MLSELSSFWNMLPPDMKSFIVGMSVNLTSQLLTSLGKKKTNDIKASLEDAYMEGIKYITKSFYDNNVDIDYIQGLLENDGIKSLLVDIVKDPSLSQDTGPIENALREAGVDVSTISDFDINAAITSFLKGFMSKAELSDKLIPFLNLQIMKRILSRMEEKKPDLDFLKRKYFNYLKEKYAQMSFKGLSEGKLLSFPLRDIYTKLSFTEALASDRMEYLKRKEQMDGSEFVERVKGDTTKLSDIINAQYSVITGEPGSGKSTLLKYVAVAFIDNKQKERLEIKDSYLPIIFPIAAYAEGCKKVGSLSYSLKEFIPEYFKGEGLPNLMPLFEAALKNNSALILLDGLDEVSDETERKKMVSSIRNFIGDIDYSSNKYIVTCRIASYTKATRFEKMSGKDFSHYTILPFDMDAVERFLFNWYLCYEREINKRVETAKTEAKKKLDKMMFVIQKDKNILDLATNPLMLTILALIEHEGGELPENRADLYGKCLKMLSGSWEKLRSLHETELPEFSLGGRKITEDFVVDFLGPIAYEMHDKALPDIEYKELKERLVKKFDLKNKDMLLSKEQADDLIRILKERSGILQEVSPGAYGFMHLTFKEYLSTRVLTDLSDDRIELLGDKLFKPEWREVILLTAATLKRRDTSNFIRKIFEKDVDHFKNLILAGECVLDTGLEKVDERLYDELICKMKEIAEGDTAIEDRVSVGETLGWLGDTRDLKEFISVEGGAYNLSLGKVTIEPFEIGKYPVTNGWFEEFMKAEGYKNKEFWSNEGRKWLDHTKAEHPRFWNDRKWKCPTSPVVGITWYEAYAFTKWLTLERNDRYKYRLLDENEWEAAAAGFDGREYAWGDGWDRDKCNNEEIKIEKTSPVGIFKKGDTPEGISDLSGNVWEWTLSDYHSKKILKDFKFDEEVQELYDKGEYYDAYKRYEEKVNTLPVFRGGSWSNQGDFCRCALRFRYNPLYGDGDVGFRCARAQKT